jgi:hypothetical protein
MYCKNIEILLVHCNQCNATPNIYSRQITKKYKTFLFKKKLTCLGCVEQLPDMIYPVHTRPQLSNLTQFKITKIVEAEIRQPKR